MSAHEKINGRELTVSSRLWGPMIMAQSRLGEITAQSRRGHSSVTARSNSVTARSQLNHGIFSMITAQSPLGHLNHGPGHGSVLAGCDHFGHRELTMSSRWPIFFSWVGIAWKYKAAIFTLTPWRCLKWRAQLLSYCFHCQMFSLGKLLWILGARKGNLQARWCNSLHLQWWCQVLQILLSYLTCALF